MKYLVMIGMMVFSSVAFAQPGNGYGKELEFKCHFRMPKKHGVTCKAWGEVCIRKGGHTMDATSVESNSNGCGGTKPVELSGGGHKDSRLHVACSDGTRWNEDAFGVFRKDDGDKEFFIVSHDKDEAVVIAVEDFDRHDKKQSATLRFFDRDHGEDPVRQLFGSCRFEWKHKGHNNE